MDAIQRQFASIAAALSIAVVGATAAAAPAAAQSPEQVKQAVERELRGDRALRRLEVSVAGDEVTLTGRVRHFWDKNEALRRTFDVRGVGTVVSAIEVPVQEDQEELVEDVSRAIQRYPHYRIWDYIDGRIDDGVVSIFGRVTPERDKAGELFERIAKVRGVQDVQMNVTPLSPSRSDDRLRAAIGRRLFSSEHFQRFASMPNPPFHIIVNNSVVTLIGYVQSQIEYIEMQRIVAQTQGVLRVDNQIQTIR
ncbi:MAG: BON domain-containing protein [Acidobacteria bacterium]|nr:BON domain-containing protein [Acidobacteriota bacterium]MCY4636329.1 BON domain-containing protein [Acidobacteriota bacterium]